MGAVFGVADLGQELAGRRLGRLVERGQDAGDLVHPAPCSVVSGHIVRSAAQSPSAPSPTATIGARIPRRLRLRSRSAQLSVDSRCPSVMATSSLVPSARTPTMTGQHSRALLQAHVEVHPVGPHVHEVAVIQSAFGEGPLLALPLRGQPGDHRRREPRGGAEELAQGRSEVARAHPV